MDSKIVKVEYEREDGAVLVVDNTNFLIPNDGITGVNAENWTIYSEPLGNKEGSIITGKSMTGRDFSITFETQDDTDSIREDVRKFFNLDKEFKATLTYRGVTRWVSGFVSIYDNPPQNVYDIQKITINMFCPDPFWKSVDDFNQDSASVIPRWGFPYIQTETSNYLCSVYEFNQSIDLINDGDTKANVIIDIDFYGTVIEPVITDVKTGLFYKLNESYSNGDKIHIDMDKGIITLNGIKAHNRVNVESSSLYIPTGGTTFKLSASSGLDYIHAFISYYQPYRGI